MRMLGPSEKPKDCDSAFTLNHGFKGYSLRRHLGDSPFLITVQSLWFCIYVAHSPTRPTQTIAATRSPPAQKKPKP
ncbi:hypothetical protein AwEntero_18220 [Enterobacterales bacterium]|nr:hypothetical protein AwEntero_18220 [Enterobacterales bacterium]